MQPTAGPARVLTLVLAIAFLCLACARDDDAGQIRKRIA